LDNEPQTNDNSKIISHLSLKKKNPVVQKDYITKNENAFLPYWRLT
jgi:hypothetical protein